jgi:prepilin-type N-terminal cleavage/methylation domain-containing protein
MKSIKSKGFTMIEIVIVIVIAGIIGSMAASLLYQGAEMYVEETNRQGFVSESRSAFWRLMREAQGQRSPGDFNQSGQENLYLRNAKNLPRVFQTNSESEFEFSLDGSNYNDLSTYLSSNSFYFYNNVFSDITPSAGSVLSPTEAETVHMTKLGLTFQKNTDETLSLTSYIYPINFRFGKKMSYHD